MPFVRSMVPEVDVAARRLVVEPPAGLLDLTDAADLTEEPDEPADPSGP